MTKILGKGVAKRGKTIIKYYFFYRYFQKLKTFYRKNSYTVSSRFVILCINIQFYNFFFME